MSKLTKIISGGQTGVDQAALRAARDSGLEIGGWCPPGRGCEAGGIPGEFPLRETEQERSPDAPDVPRSQRTEWNVRDSDGVLVIQSGDVSQTATDDAGTAWAIECAARYQKALLICDPGDSLTVLRIHEWLAANNISVLSVGGPSELNAPGIGDRTYTLLLQVFKDRN